MPFFIGPYTLGTQLPAAPTVVGGGAYSYRKHRFLTYMAGLVSLLLMWPL